MPTIDHAAVRFDTPAERARPSPSAGWPRVSRTALTFVSLWLPLTAVALVTGWRGSWAAPDEPGSLLGDYVNSGSAISGPLAPQLILLLLACGARRSDRIGRLSTAAIGVMGVLVAFNGAASALTEHEHAPQAAALVAGLGIFAPFGVAMAVLAARRLLAADRV